MANDRAALNVRVHADISRLRESLRTIGPMLDTTRAQLRRASESFDGARIVGQASAAVAAIDKLGGVASLTAAEKRKLNATLTEAIEKYRALGRQAPPEMIKLAEATKATEKSTSGLLSTLSTGAVAFGTAIGTFVGKLAYDAVRKLGEEFVALVRRGNEVRATTTTFEQLTASIGATSQEMLRAGREGTRGLVSGLEIMKATNKAIMLDLPVTTESMRTMTQAAVVLGKAMGQDATKSLDDLITALGRGSTQILDNLGLVVKQGEANEKYAQQLGKTAAQLTDAEKKQAFFNAAMEAARERVEALGDSQLTLGDQLQRVRTRWTDLLDALSDAIHRSPVLNRLFSELADSIDRAFGEDQATKIDTLTLAVNHLTLAVVSALPSLMTALQVFQRLAAGAMLAFPITNLGMSPDERKAVIRAFRGETVLDQWLEAMKPEIERIRAELEELVNDLGTPLATPPPGLVGGLSGGGADGGSAPPAPEKISDLKKRIDELTGRAMQAQVNQLAREVELAGEAGGLAAYQVFELGKQLVTLRDRGAEIPPVLQQLIVAHERLAFVQRFGIGSAKHWVESMQREYIPTVEQMTLRMHAYLMHPNTLAKALKPQDPAKLLSAPELGHWQQFFQQEFGGVLMRAIEGGGNVFQAAGASIGKHLFSASGGFGKAASQAVSKIPLIGSILGSMLPGIGTIAGSLLGPAISGLGKLFGFGSAGRDLVVQFADSMGGFDALRERLAGLGDEGENLWRMLTQGVGRNNPKEAQRAIDQVRLALERSEQRTRQLQDAFGRLQGAVGQLGGRAPAELQPLVRELLGMQGLTDDLRLGLEGMLGEPTVAAMEAAAERLGVSFDVLGTRFQQAKLSETALQVVRDLKLLEEGGADMTQVLLQGKDSIQALVDTAIRTGGVLPETLRPYIQRLIELGQLVDPNGELITNIDQLSFAEIEDQVLKDIRDILTEIRDLLSHDIPQAAKDTMNAFASIEPPELPSAPNPQYDIYGNPWQQAHTGALVTMQGIRRFHRGGAQIVPFPRLRRDEFPAILQAGESVLNREATTALGPATIAALNRGVVPAGGGAVSVSVGSIVVHGAPGQSPEAIARAVEDRLLRRLPYRLKAAGF